ncbi:MAG TPA: bi-domain-containing oxidoreductase [Blastocatellia bacterium]|nr:bi-domain-containing oxidoreductase [Blastocatellia bacterium]
MKQVVQNYRTGELAVEELPPPSLRPGGVLVQTAYSLISAGTERTIVETAQNSLVGKARERPDLVRQVFDTFKREGLKATYEKVKAKLNQIKPLGYSASGLVIAVGPDAGEFRVGDRVACAGAGYASHAEVIYVPKNLCVKVPDNATLESACYTTVGAIALQGIRQADARLGETVAVIGLGLVGQLTVQILKAAGCQVIGIDVNKEACELAKKSGADLAVSDQASARTSCASLTEGRGADCVLVTAGTKSNEPVELAGELARDRAKVVIVGLVGMDVPRHSYYMKELELKLSRSYGPGRYDPNYEEKGIDYPAGYVRWTEKRNMEAFLRLIATGEVKTELLTTHRFAVSRASDAYALILGKGGERYCGVVLEYTEADRSPLKPAVATPVRSARSDELTVSFIGAGSFARGVLLPLVRRSPKVRLTSVATATGISAKNTAEQYGFSHSTTDYEQVLEDSSRCVFIATRHDSHASLAASALRRGKAVFVEKPLATTADGLRDVVMAARESSGLLMVGYNRRFAPIARDIKKRLSGAGPKTILYRVNAGQLPPDHWALDGVEGGGRVIGEVCHFIDFIQFLTDSLPATVSATTVAQNAGGGFVDDSVAIRISMTDGSVASIIYTASGDTSVAKEYVEVFADRSVAVIEDYKSGYFVKGGKKTRLGGRSQDKGHANEIESFISAARGQAAPPIGIESLTATSLACFAVNEAARDDSVVRIDLRALFNNQEVE